MASFMVLLWKRLNFLPDAISRRAVMVMMPRPPICIRRRITPWPKADQWLAVSLTTRPVTQMADVEVNSESVNEVHSRLMEDMGSIRSRLPARMMPAKPNIIIRKGFLFCL
jgi:hypothetical protein